MKFIKNYFKIDEQATSIKTEIISGFITFFAMCYILFVNPVMLSDAGANPNTVFFATALCAGIASLIMGILGNKPFGIAPGMGLNSLMVYTICGLYGFSFNEALAITIISAILYFILTITNFRQKILTVIPSQLKKAISIGIGLFIAMVGFVTSGFIKADSATLITLGNLLDPKVLITLFGLILMIILTAFKVKGTPIISLFLTIIFGIILTLCNLDTGVSFNGIISLPKDINFTGFFEGFKTFEVSDITKIIISCFSILFLAIFNVAGNVGANEEILNLKDKKTVNKVLLADSISFFTSGFAGTSPVTIYSESMAGIEVGARTGLSNIVVGLCFLVSIFFSPLLSVITVNMTAPILIMVGFAMIKEVKNIEWDNVVIAISSFFIIILMVITYSITNGIAIGLIIYILLKLLTYKKENGPFFKQLPILLLVLALIFIIYFVILFI